MTHLEKEAKSKRRRRVYEHSILAALQLAGIVTVALLAPNALKILETFNLVPTRRNPKYSMGDAIDRLKVKGLIKLEKSKGDNAFTITNKGRMLLYQLEAQSIALKKPRKWDERWRVIIFDIPETRKRDRDSVRATLHNLGFYLLQDSVWVYPYDCEEVMTLLKYKLKIGNDLLYMIVEEIENDKSLKEHFKL